MLLALLEVGDLAGQVVVVGLDGGAPRRDLGETGAPRPRPPGFVGPGLALLVGGLALVADVDRRRCALEDVELLGHLGQLGDRLHGGGTGADDPDHLALEVDVVAPPGRVERLALVRLHALDARQLGLGQDAVGQHDEARPHRVAPVRRHRPARRRPRPRPSSRPSCGTGSGRRTRTSRPSTGSTRGSRSPTRTSSTGRSPSPPAAGSTSRTRRRRRCPGTGSSTTSRRRHRPSRRTARRRTRPATACTRAAGRRTRRRRPARRTRPSTPRAARLGRVHVVEVLAELALHRHVVRRAAAGLLELAVLLLLLGAERRPRRVPAATSSDPRPS